MRSVKPWLGPAGLALAALLVVTLAGCASGGGRPSGAVSTQEVPFLLPPDEGWSGTLTPSQSSWLSDRHRGLLGGDDLTRLRAEIVAELARDPDFVPASVLEAQTRFVERQYQSVLDSLEPIRQASPGYVAAEVTYGRAAERVGRTLVAFEAYWSVKQDAAAAAQRVEAMLDTVIERLGRQVDEQLAEGLVAEAEETVAKMDLYAPEDVRTLQAAQGLAAASGDLTALLARLRTATDEPGADPELVRRRVELELQVGDPAAAVRLAEGLTAADPADPGLAELLRRAQFTWRLNVLPPEVRRLARVGELSRADFAVLVYWLFPSVRYGRSAEGRIATDIIDHPERERIVRVINLGLLEVDSVHRFEPDRAITAGDAQRALLRLLEGSETGATCLGSSGRLAPSADLCAAAQSCGLAGVEEECDPAAGLSGAQALELIRRTLAGIDQAS